MKFKFFELVGFQKKDSEYLKKSLIIIVQLNEVVKVDRTKFGTKYVVDGNVLTLLGRNIVLRTEWIIETNENIPKFVTAYPKS